MGLYYYLKYILNVAQIQFLTLKKISLNIEKRNFLTVDKMVKLECSFNTFGCKGTTFIYNTKIIIIIYFKC